MSTSPYWKGSIWEINSQSLSSLFLVLKVRIVIKAVEGHKFVKRPCTRRSRNSFCHTVLSVVATIKSIKIKKNMK